MGGFGVYSTLFAMDRCRRFGLQRSSECDSFSHLRSTKLPELSLAARSRGLMPEVRL